MKREQRDWVRSPKGQLSLMGAVFAGSVLFSIAAALSRGVFFERYIYDKFEPPAAHLATLGPSQIAALPDADRRALYGQRIDTGKGVDLALLADRPAQLHGWVRGTLVTGNPAQRRAATQALSVLWGRGIDAEVERSARYALARAERIGDSEWAAQAQAVLDAR